MGYHITEIHYRDIYGSLLWKDKMIFSRLHGVGEEMVEKSVHYIVKRVAVADDVQHVNIEEKV